MVINTLTLVIIIFVVFIGSFIIWRMKNKKKKGGTLPEALINNNQPIAVNPQTGMPLREAEKETLVPPTDEQKLNIR